MSSRTINANIRLSTSRSSTSLLVLLASFLFVSCSICQAQETRTDLPSNGSLRIENRRGNIIVEAWEEKDVSVVAAFEGETPKTSPVIIRRTQSLLNVLVASGATASASAIRVNLILRIPKRAQVEIITRNGVVEVRGMPASLKAQTYSGDIHVYLPTEDSANIKADTSGGEITGSITNRLQGNWRSGGLKYFTTNPRGGAPLRLRSKDGNVTLNLLAESNKTATNKSNEIPESAADSKDGRATPPTLVGAGGKQSAGTPASPSTGEPQEIDEGDVVRVDTELVTLNVSVVDRTTSRGLKGLAKIDFKLFEDGIEQQIGHFESSNAPFNLVLVIDLSGSTKDKLALIRNAAQHFVDAARSEDNIAVIAFAGTPVLVSNLTSDRTALRKRIGAIETAPGDTKLYDSLNFAMTDALIDASKSRRNAVVVMSDGLDGTLPSVRGEGSALSYSEALSQIREFDGVLYAIWVDTEYESLSDEDTQPEDFDTGHDRMAEMADAGGGLFYEVAKLEDLSGAYDRVVADIGTVYSLAYRPQNEVRDGKWRAIRVKMAPPNAVARGKSGYFAR